MAKLSALGYLGIASETTFGTAIAPVLYVPYTSVKVEDVIKKNVDSGIRATLAKDYAVYNSTRHSTVDIESLAYPDTLGYFFKGIMGADTVTGSSAPYTHKFTLANTNAPSYTISDYNVISGTQERRYAGSILDQLDIKFDNMDEIKVSAKYQGKVGSLTTKTTPTQTILQPFLGWNAQLTLNGTANVNMLGGDISIKRTNELIYTANDTQDPSKYVTGVMEITGKLTFDVDDETEYLLFLNSTQPSIKVVFTVSASETLTIQLSKVDIAKANVDKSAQNVRVDMSFTALYNTTDSGLATITLLNSVATY